MSTPIYAMRDSALLRSTPGMVLRSATSSSHKGAITRSISSLRRYGLLQVVDVGQYIPDHEGVVRRKVPFEGLFELRDLLAQAPLGQLRQNLRVGGAAKERLDHRPPRSSQHRPCNRGELDPGLLEHLLKTLALLGPLLYLPLAVAGEVPELPDLFWRHEAGAHHSPYSSSWQLHSASLTSVFLPGTFLRCLAFSSQHSKSSSS